MKQVEDDSSKTALLPEGTRVAVTVKGGHRQNGRTCIIIGAAPNPFGRAEDQWYDVQFEDHIVERFLAKYLVRATPDMIRG